MQAHIFVLGFVQGVGYRQFVKSRAEKLGLTGWVTNLPDGRVEAVFQGEKDQLSQMVEICKKGPFLSEIKSVDINYEPETALFDDIKIIR